MYNSHFGFVKRPFASVPDIGQYFPGSTIEDARTVLARCLERGEGHAMVIGPSGVGKTLLCRLLAEQLKDSFQVAVLASGRLSSRRNLFQAILYELSRPYRSMDEGELRLSLVDYLTNDEACPRGMVVLVDEAHTLPLRLLDELRMLTNVARGGEPAVRLVLAGAGVLEERFASPKLDSFSQRVVARCYLEALNRSETQDYIQCQIESARSGILASATTSAASSAGARRDDRVFSVDACRSVHQVTEGVPRLINQVCDHALLLTYSGGREQITSADVDEAWADLQQLPTPWNEDSSEEGGVIEFGGLDDLPEDVAEDDGVACDEEPATPSLRISPTTEEAYDRTAPRSDEVDPGRHLYRIEKLLGDLDEEFQPVGSIHPEVELVFVDPFEEEFEQEEVVVDRYDRPVAKEQEESLPRETAAARVETTQSEVAAKNSQGPAVSVKLEEVVRWRGEEPRQEDILLVGESDGDATGTRSVIAVRRHEFGQLFAKLRRG